VKGVPLSRVALYTAVHPLSLKYVADWAASVRAQTDQGFDLWISVDGVAPAEVVRAIGHDLDATWLVAEPGATVGRVRDEAITQMVAACDAIVFTDSDDRLAPSRVEAARKGLRDLDGYGCALRLMDETGADLGETFGWPAGEDVEATMPRYNVMGLSNTAWRSEVLRQCLPVPAACELVDWYLATQAWGRGARLGFDRVCRMWYRQYGQATAPVRPPFSAEQVLRGAERVVGHYRLVLDRAYRMEASRLARLQEAADRARRFLEAVGGSPETLARYVAALNDLPLERAWWTFIARPELENLWNR